MNLRPATTDLSTNTRNALRASGFEQTYSAGDVLFHEGAPSTSVFLIESGLVKVAKVAPDGRSSLVSLRRAGALVGEQAVLDGHPRSASLIALAETTAVAISAAAFTELLSTSPDLSLMLLRQFSARLRESSHRILEHATASARSRVASRIVDLVPDEELRSVASRGNTNGQVTLRLPISQSELGEWAGLSRESVVKALKELRDAGLIETARKTIIIRDLAGLQAMDLDWLGD